MLTKPIAELVFADIEALCASQIAESRTLEFKRDLPGARDEDRREFLADVSAIANTAGGDLIFGIEETGGIATAVRPISVDDPDTAVRRLEDMLRTGIEPRLPEMTPKWIAGSRTGGGVIIIRVPRSWAAPHRVTFRDHGKFYARTSTGKYALDVSELRAAFAAAEGIPGRIRSFRRERLELMAVDELPVPLVGGARLIFHIIPVSAFVTPLTIQLPTERHFFPPLESTGFSFLHTLEGFATYTAAMPGEDVRAYTLVFRNGIVESITGDIGYSDQNGAWVLPGRIEGPLLQALPAYFNNLDHLGVEPPFYLALTLHSVRSTRMYLPYQFRLNERMAQRRTVVHLPEVLVSDVHPDPVRTLKPVFDLMWQAFGHSTSRSFDAEGRYVGDR